MTNYSTLFIYSNGSLFAHADSTTRHKKGVALGTKQGKYLTVSVEGKNVHVHRIIWEMHNGPIAEGQEIDHIDRNPSNNLIENLRLANRSENQCNRGRFETKTNDLPKNIFPSGDGFLVMVGKNNNQVTGGVFDTLEEAVMVARRMRDDMHGEFACHDITYEEAILADAYEQDMELTRAGWLNEDYYLSNDFEYSFA